MAIPGIRKSGPEQHALLKRQNEEKTEREDEDYQSDAKEVHCAAFSCLMWTCCAIFGRTKYWKKILINQKYPCKVLTISLQTFKRQTQMSEYIPIK